MQKISTFAERLKEAIGSRANNEVAAKVGISKQAISMYISGARHPVKPIITALAKELSVNEAWLLGYDVDKHMPANIIPIHKTKRAPLIGQIACGTPILAEENIEDYIPYPDFMSADFCLRCKGDSMINAGIYDGDIVFIHQQPEVEDGEIAAVRVGTGECCEATLKRIYYGKNKITLVAENPNYRNMVFEKKETNEIEIIGKAVWYLSRVK